MVTAGKRWEHENEEPQREHIRHEQGAVRQPANRNEGDEEHQQENGETETAVQQKQGEAQARFSEAIQKAVQDTMKEEERQTEERRKGPAELLAHAAKTLHNKPSKRRKKQGTTAAGGTEGEKTPNKKQQTIVKQEEKLTPLRKQNKERKRAWRPYRTRQKPSEKCTKGRSYRREITNNGWNGR
jgi:hypothetical protein